MNRAEPKIAEGGKKVNFCLQPKRFHKIDRVGRMNQKKKPTHTQPYPVESKRNGQHFH